MAVGTGEEVKVEGMVELLQCVAHTPVAFFFGGAVSSIEVGRSNPLSQSTIIGLFSMVGNQISTILRKVKVDGAIPKIKFGTP